jgi:3-hydroxyisobutyrate dehydrogenase
MNSNIEKIGFIGTGVMGASMAINLINGGYTVAVYNRAKEKALPVIKKGAIWMDTVSKIAKWADVVITMVGYPKDVEEVYFGDNGIINNARKGCYIVDMTTSKPSLAQRIYKEAKEKGIHAIDAPVSGGDVGAKNGTLAIMAGGDEEAFNTLKPIFSLLGKSLNYMGGPGFGQHTKMCNQISIAATIMGVCEALVYAKNAGLDPEKVIECISGGAAGSWQLANNGFRMLKGDFDPGFYIKHFVKDMNIAIEESEAMGIKTPALKLSRSLYGILMDNKGEDFGTQALFKIYTEPDKYKQKN